MGIALRVRGNNQKTAGEYLRKAKEHRCRKTANPENKRLILPVAAHKSAGRTEYQPTRYSESRFSLGTVAQHLLAAFQETKCVRFSARARSASFNACACHSGEENVSESRDRSSQITSIMRNFSMRVRFSMLNMSYLQVWTAVYSNKRMLKICPKFYLTLAP